MLKAIPQATIDAKRKLMRQYAPMLDWNCGIKEGEGLQNVQLVRTTPGAAAAAADAPGDPRKKCADAAGGRVWCSGQTQWPPEEKETLRHWPPAEVEAEVKKAEAEIEALKAAAREATKQAAAEATQQLKVTKQLVKQEATAEAQAAVAQGKKCANAAGEPVWCDSLPQASPLPLPSATAAKKSLAKQPLAKKPLAKQPLAKKLQRKQAAAAGPEKKCTDAAGEPIWCDGATPSPSPTASPAAAGPEKKCTDAAGAPIWCDDNSDRPNLPVA